MTFGQVKNQHCNYYLHYSEDTVVSPLSTLSEVDFAKHSLEELFDKNRQDSPDVLASCANRTAVPALFSARPLTYADVVNGITHKKQEDSLLSGKTFELRLPKLLSEKECTCSYMEDCVTCVTELGPQSPNSPVPQLRSSHTWYNVEHRLFTPESTFSNWESTDLCLVTNFDERIPQSTRSYISDIDLEPLVLGSWPQNQCLSILTLNLYRTG